MHQLIKTRTMMLIRMIDFTRLIDLTGDEVKIKFMKMTLKSLKKPLKTLKNHIEIMLATLYCGLWTIVDFVAIVDYSGLFCRYMEKVGK